MTPKSKRVLSREDRLFLDGVLAALAVVRFHGSDTLFDEIVRANGETELLDEARHSGQMTISGMAHYRRRQK